MQAENINLLSLNLTSEERNNPLNVINDFFDVDCLSGHLNTLRDWCYSALKDDYYRDMKGSPSSLLHFHKLTIRLIEAAYLLKEEQHKLPANTILVSEANAISFYPLNLTADEQLNPYLVFAQVFELYDLLQYRFQLYEWLEYGLSSRAANEFIESADLMHIYENLQRLFTAAWIVNQRSTDKPRLKDKEVCSSEENLVVGSAKLYKADPMLTGDRVAKVKNVLAVIRTKVPLAQVVIFLGAVPSDSLYFLLLTANENTCQAHQIASMVEESCAPIADIIVLVHFTSALYIGLKHENQFFNATLHSPVVYLSGDVLLPVARPIHLNEGDTTFKWERWRNQGNDFLKGAKFHLEDKAFNAALFCLHQCTECFLVAIIRAVLGYNINNHNLTRLLNITELFTTELKDVFELENDNRLLLFNELKTAYVNVRYKDIYQANPVAVEQLYLIVAIMTMVAENVYCQNLKEANL